MNSFLPIIKEIPYDIRKRWEDADRLIAVCDGMTSVEKVLEILSEGNAEIREHFSEMLGEFRKQGYIVDSREQLMEMHRLSDNPSYFYRRASEEEFIDFYRNRPAYIIDYISEYSAEAEAEAEADGDEFLQLLKNRVSCRSFNNNNLKLKHILYIARCGYSMNIKPVAAAGRLYPIVIYALVRTAEEAFALYAFDCENDRLLLIEERVDPRLMEYTLNDDEHIYNAPCIFFVMADLKRYSLKYANRGYRFAILEAGHVVQSMTLAAVNRDLQSIEYGGFRDEAVRKLLKINREAFVPVSCLAAGYGDNSVNVEIPFHTAALAELTEKGIINGVQQIYSRVLMQANLMAYNICLEPESLLVIGIGACTKNACREAMFSGLAFLYRKSHSSGYGAGQTEAEAKARAVLDFLTVEAVNSLEGGRPARQLKSEQLGQSIAEKIGMNVFRGMFMEFALLPSDGAYFVIAFVKNNKKEKAFSCSLGSSMAGLQEAAEKALIRLELGISDICLKKIPEIKAMDYDFREENNLEIQKEINEDDFNFTPIEAPISSVRIMMATRRT